MKRLMASLLALCILLSCTVLIVNAEENEFVKKENLAIMEGCTYSWSGTWQNNGVDSEAGDPGHKCFDGNVDYQMRVPMLPTEISGYWYDSRKR